MKFCLKKQVSLAAGATLVVLTAQILADNAGGAIRQPSSALSEPLQALEAPRQQYEKQMARAALIARLREQLARFRPVDRKQSEFALTGNEAFLQSKTTIEAIFHPEMARKVKAQYEGAVRPVENDYFSPQKRMNAEAYERYRESQRGLGNWLAKEIGQDQLREFFRRGDSSNGTMKVLNTVREMSSTQKEDPEAVAKAEAKLSEQERIAKAHRKDTPAKKEASVPTRLRAKVNLVKTQGMLTFQNKILNTVVEAKASGDDRLAVEVNKEFRDLGTYSKVRYAVDKNLITMSMNQKITKQVALEMNAERYTAGKRGSVGEKSRGTAKVTYSLSF